MSDLSGELWSWWSILGVHLWQSSLVLLPVLLLVRILHNAPARIISTLLGLALLKLLLPRQVVGEVGSQAVQLLATTLGWDLATGSRQLVMVHLVLDPGTLIPDGGTPLLSGAILTITAIWILVATLGMIRIGRQYRRQRREILVGMVQPSPPLDSSLKIVGQATGIPQRAIRCGDLRGQPRVMGLLRPVIYLPRDLVTELPHDELVAVVLHENSHRLRRDPLRLLLLRIFSALLFFYPPVIPLQRGLRRVMELLGDEYTLQRGVTPATLNRALARCVKFGLTPAGGTLAPAAGGESFLKSRFHRNCTRRRYFMFRYGVALAFALLLLGGTSVLPPDGFADTDSQVVEFDTPPAVITMVPPEYPQEALDRKISGDVLLQLTIDEEGAVVVAEIVRGVPECSAMDQAALAVIRQWVFSPATKGGEAVRSMVMVPVAFRLSDKE